MTIEEAFYYMKFNTEDPIFKEGIYDNGIMLNENTKVSVRMVRIIRHKKYALVTVEPEKKVSFWIKLEEENEKHNI